MPELKIYVAKWWDIYESEEPKRQISQRGIFLREMWNWDLITRELKYLLDNKKRWIKKYI